MLVENVCRHAFCLTCWLGCIETAINTSNPFTLCMDASCGTPLLNERVEAILTFAGEKSLHKKYHKKIC